MGRIAKSVRGSGERVMCFGVEAVEGEEQALVEHSAACCVRLRAFRTRSYNFRSRKKPEKLTTEATASQKGKVQGSSV
jgi:hypothetical protein